MTMIVLAACAAEIREPVLLHEAPRILCTPELRVTEVIRLPITAPDALFAALSPTGPDPRDLPFPARLTTPPTSARPRNAAPDITIAWSQSEVVCVASEAALRARLETKAAAELVDDFVEQRLPEHHGLTAAQATNMLRHVLREKVGQVAFDAIPEMGSADGAKVVADLFERAVGDLLTAAMVPFRTEEDLKSEFELSAELQGLAHGRAPKTETQAGPCHADKQGNPWLATRTKKAGTIGQARRESQGSPGQTTRTAKQRNPSQPKSLIDSFQPTGEVDSRGRALYAGQCAACKDHCVMLPFKPWVKMTRPPICDGCDPTKLLTPDFLLSRDDSPKVHINGTPVAWIDCKLFYGSPTSTHDVKQIRRQAARYNKRWGPGAIVFALGFGEGLQVDSTLLLDASPLDLDRVHDAIRRSVAESTGRHPIDHDRNV